MPSNLHLNSTKVTAACAVTLLFLQAATLAMAVVLPAWVAVAAGAALAGTVILLLRLRAAHQACTAKTQLINSLNSQIANAVAWVDNLGQAGASNTEVAATNNANYKLGLKSITKKSSKMAGRLKESPFLMTSCTSTIRKMTPTACAST